LENKQAEALRQGAQRVVILTDSHQMETFGNMFDYIIDINLLPR